MNPLDQYPSVRRALYTVQWILNGAAAVLGAFFVANGTATDALPEWYVIGLAVLPVLWTYLGLTAAANTPAPEEPAHRGEVGASDLVLLLVFASFVLLVLILTGVLR